METVFPVVIISAAVIYFVVKIGLAAYGVKQADRADRWYQVLKKIVWTFWILLVLFFIGALIYAYI